MWHPPKAKGVLIAGTGARCGKTVAAAGLAGVLNELGFRIQAVKPLSFIPKVSVRGEHDNLFFQKILPPLENVETIAAESPATLTPIDGQRLVEGCGKRVYPYLLETPGGLASPLKLGPGQLLTAVDLAKALNLPLLLVTPRQPDLLGALLPAFAYLEAQQADCIGWLSVETAPVQVPDWEEQVFYLSQARPVPYLGEIAYSPSISVEALQQGNLLRTTEQGLDLFPLQQALDLMIAPSGGL